jgi:hypothetical protein
MLLAGKAGGCYGRAPIIAADAGKGFIASGYVSGVVSPFALWTFLSAPSRQILLQNERRKPTVGSMVEVLRKPLERPFDTLENMAPA